MEELTGAAFPIVADRDAAIVRELELVDPFEFRPAPVAVPAVFLVDDSGVVRYHYVGRAPEDRPRTELLILAAEEIDRQKC